MTIVPAPDVWERAEEIITAIHTSKRMVKSNQCELKVQTAFVSASASTYESKTVRLIESEIHVRNCLQSYRIMLVYLI